MNNYITMRELILEVNDVIDAFNSHPYMNMCKLSEEVGELAEQTILGLTNREATIDEIADVIICAVGQGTFINMTVEELTATLIKKLNKAKVVAEAGGKAAYLKAKETKSGE